MSSVIPGPVLATCAEIVAERETHASLDNLFIYAGASGDPPEGSKPVKALAWLRNTNKDPKANPLAVLGKIIENYMEEELRAYDSLDQVKAKHRDRLQRVLSQCELQYAVGGKVIGSLGAPSRTLEEFIRERDVGSIDEEFRRATANVDASPREAVSAASNILESVCKVYIAEEGLEEPAKQDLKSVWTPVRKHLGFDPSTVEDSDLQRILTGLISITDGIGALRTHASSAHGAGVKAYKLEPRHARLAIHASHTVVLFVLESWKKRRAS
jgi:hypothetical protein